MPQAKHMRELGCFSMMFSPVAMESLLSELEHRGGLWANPSDPKIERFFGFVRSGFLPELAHTASVHTLYDLNSR
jgi:hypothetical protein